MIGRFISADSLVPDLYNPQSLNRYSYCYNNPLKYVDPNGHSAIDRAIATGWGVAFGEPTPVGEVVMTVVTIARGVYVVAQAIESTVTSAEQSSKSKKKKPDVSQAGSTGNADPNDSGDGGNNNDDSGSSNKKKDRYENPGHHDPSQKGPNSYKGDKSVLPENHQELWDKSQKFSDGNRWTKVGKGKKAKYHRFQNDGNGNWHWNGSTDGATKSGKPRNIKLNDVPPEVKRLK